jgi:hypothetical protein
MRESKVSDLRRSIDIHSGMQLHAAGACGHFREVSKRPVRHNRGIERAALWHVLELDQQCMSVLDAYGQLDPDLVRPQTGSAESRYEAEAAIRTIPSLSPFTRPETAILSRSLNLRNFEFEHGIGDLTLGRLALRERWHEWLWDNGPERAQERSSESQVLELACGRLSVALYDVVATFHREHPIE